MKRKISISIFSVFIITLIMYGVFYKVINNSFPSIEENIRYLCSDEISNREYNYKGNKTVEKYLQSLCEKLGLESVIGDSFLVGFTYDNYKLNNVVGKVSGSDNTKAIILTAHFDAWYNGAIDNASGVATVLEIANILKKYSTESKLSYDVIICFTNAEMAGITGSEIFVEQITEVYKDICNINIDCIGAREAGPLALKNISRVKKSQQLYITLKEVLEEDNIAYSDEFSTEKVKMAYEQNIGVSDYFRFEQKDIPNIHIAQQGIGKLILNKDDTIDKIDYNKLKAIASTISRFIKRIILE